MASTGDVPLLTLAVVAVAVGALHYAGRARALASAPVPAPIPAPLLRHRLPRPLGNGVGCRKVG